jgi:hypothetical protein
MKDITQLDMNYDIRRFRDASATSELPGFWLFYSLDNGATWTIVSALNPRLVGGEVTVPNSVGVTPVRNKPIILRAPWAVGATALFRWVDDNATVTSPDQFIGLDNVSLAATGFRINDPPRSVVSLGSNKGSAEGALDGSGGLNPLSASGDASTQTTSNALPLPWTSTDIGTGQSAGSATHSAGTFTHAGSGSIGSTADKLRFSYQALTGDGEIIAKISNLQNTGSDARVGVMIRDSLASNAMGIFIGMSESDSYRWDRRSSTGGSTTSTSSTGTAPETWVRLVRSGDTITAYKSSDGTSWTSVGSTNDTTIASTSYIGLAVSSGSDTTLNTSQFSNVSVTP